MRERNIARNERVLRTINGFESIAHLAHFLPPHLHYGRYDLCSNCWALTEHNPYQLVDFSSCVRREGSNVTF
jgi:hypothetical protein